MEFCTGTDSAREDPGSGGDSSFDQPLPKHLLELGLQLKVLQTSVDRDEEGGQLQLPVFHHQVEQGVRLGVVRHPDVLRTNIQSELPKTRNTVFSYNTGPFFLYVLYMYPGI